MKSIINELWHGNKIPQEDSRTNSKEMKELLGYSQGITRTWRKDSPMSRKKHSKNSTIVGVSICALERLPSLNMPSNLV